METNPHKIFQQSVTMTAKMWPQANTTAAGAWELGWPLGVAPHHWPLLVAVFCGGALVALLVCTALLWHCCVAPHRNKDYRVKIEGDTIQRRHNFVSVLPSQTAVYLEPKFALGECGYNSRLVTSAPQWLCSAQGVPRSVSAPPPPSPSRRRSQPSPCRVVFPQTNCSLPYPHISEFSPGTHAHYLSSSILDEYGSRDLYPSLGGVMLKTQSLPACVRSRPRPVSMGDDPSELYAKVNFSKKRRNRMRNGEAAIIALSKSRSQFLHKDTDTLVDNEAVIVYDERTAL